MQLNGYNNCLILEDDFTAYDVDILNRNIERFFFLMLKNGPCYVIC
jgi:hypothetical protein